MVPGLFFENLFFGKVFENLFFYFYFRNQFFIRSFYQLPFVFSSPVFMFGNGFGFNPFCILCLLVSALPSSRVLSLRQMTCMLSMWSSPSCETALMWSTAALFVFPCWL